MRRAETLKTFRVCLRVDELEFLLQICREEEARLLLEIGGISKELFDIEDKCGVEHLTGDVILKTDFEALHERERKLKAEKYVRRARVWVVQGFIERLERLLDGTLRRGGRLSWTSLRGRELLVGTADGTWFKRRIWDDVVGGNK